MPITANGLTFSDDQIRDYFANTNDPNQWAKQVQSLGLNADQVAQAGQIAGKGWTTADVNNWAGNNGYQANSNGTFSATNAANMNPGNYAVKNDVGVTHWVPNSGPDITGQQEQYFRNQGLTQRPDGNWFDSSGRQVHGVDGSGNATYSIYDPHGGGNRMVTAAEYDAATGGSSHATGFNQNAQNGAGGTADVPVTRDAINSLYKSILGRDAESAGLDWWMSDMASDGTYNQHDIDRFTAAAQAELNAKKGNGTTNGMPQLGYNLSQIQGATNWNVDPKTQTVAGQLESVLASDSPLIQQARTRALQSMQQRGLLNSSMAQSGADAAMYDKALQIATPDAATYADAAKYNTGTANDFAQAANAFTRQGIMADFNVRANDWAANQDLARTLQRDAVQNGYQTTRDATLNGYQTTRDATLNGYQTVRDAILNGYNVANSATQHGYDVDLQKLQQDIQSQTATNNWNNQQKQFAQNQITQARSDFGSKVAAIAANTEMDSAARLDAINTLKINYNLIIKMSAQILGWNADDWIIKD